MTNQKTICLITQSHLCRNPRVLKEATTLSANGYKVYILTCLLSKLLQQEDLILIEKHPGITIHWVVDLTKKNLNALVYRALFKTGRALIRYLKFETQLSLGYGAHKYLKTAEAFRADLYCCHQELATCIGNKLIEKGFKVAFDIEDWYSEDLLPEARLTRPVNLLQKNERAALQKGIYCTTTSCVMAKELAGFYQAKQPAVIYNVFPLQPPLLNQEKDFNRPLKLFWFSQTIGPGRGLEELITLLAITEIDAELHLLGNINASYADELKRQIHGKNRIEFHPLISDAELPAKIANFDVGLALELADLPSRNYTITNKFFQYLQSGLPVIATKTAGQQEAFEKFKPGLLINFIDNKILADWLSDTAALKKAATAARQAASYYCWENESQKLLKLVNDAIG